MKRAATLGMLVAVAVSHAQNPNVVVKLDATLQLRGGHDVETRLRSYDLMGRHSVVTLSFTLEPGFEVVLSERFQRIANDPDPEQFDEYYIEDRGYWRAGKQYVVFGRGQILRESVYALRVDTRVGARAIPITLSAMNARPERQRGLAARLGTRLGVSIANGQHLGIAGTALTVIRRPEESPGKGKGWDFVGGADYHTGFKHGFLSVEHASFRDDRQEDLDVTDLIVGWRFKGDDGASLGLTNDWSNDQFFVRLFGSYEAYDGLFIEPIVRWRDGKLWDWGIGVRIKP